MFRSNDMSLNLLMFDKESLWEIMNRLAYSEKIMFFEEKEIYTGYSEDK